MRKVQLINSCRWANVRREAEIGHTVGFQRRGSAVYIIAFMFRCILSFFFVIIFLFLARLSLFFFLLIATVQKRAICNNA